MNAQNNSRNQFNFQQFVSDNKGKLITFLHTDKDNSVTKFVVDVCSEYFTCKNQEYDSKIDGFYYFSDCKIVPNKHPLQEIFETHKNVVLCYSKMLVPTFITRIDNSFIYGVCPLIGTETTHHITSIKNVLTIVNGEWKTIYTSEKEKISPPSDLNIDTSSDLYYLLNNKTVDIHTNTTVWKGFELNYISGGVIIGYCKDIPAGIHVNSVIGVTVDGVCYGFGNGKKYTKVSEKVNNTLDNLNKAFDKLFPTQEPVNIDKEQYNLIKEHAKMFIDISYDLAGYALNTINKFLNKLLFIKKRDFSLEALQEFRAAFNELKNELHPEVKNNFSKDPTFQALMKRYVEFSLLIITENSPNKDNVKNFLEIVNKSMTKAGRQEYNERFNSTQKEPSQKNIKYRGKPKTVEIVDEYTYPDGKEYVMVKDVTDEGRTKTLFKEYIEWL